MPDASRAPTPILQTSDPAPLRSTHPGHVRYVRLQVNANLNASVAGKVSEAEQWDRDGHLPLVRAEQDLDMDGVLAPSQSGRGPGVLWRRETLGRRTAWKHDDNARETHHGFGVITFDVGLPKPLAVASVHLTPWGADKALIEAQYVCSRAYRYGPFAMVGGDLNYPPAEAWPEPEYARQLPFNRGARTVLTDPDLPEPPRPDRRIAWKMRHNGFHDAARLVFDRDKDETVLARTGSDDRIDQLWVSAALAPAVVSYQLLDTPAGASDHHGLVVILDLERAQTQNPWAYR